MTHQTPGHAVDIEVDIRGAKSIHLVVDDLGHYSHDWADWVEPRFVGPKGETKLTDLKYAFASSGHGRVHLNKNCEGKPLAVEGKPVAYGIGTHANSIISYEVPSGATTFKARGALDTGGVGRSDTASVQFLVFKDRAPEVAATKRGGEKPKAAPASGPVHDAANAVANLEIHPELQTSLFASEPLFSNPANIDVDHRGRVWVAEALNYRRSRDARPEGDRILILEDTDGDAKADKSTVFYQGRDIDSPHGVCVLGNRVIVSSGEHVYVFTDEDGDDKADKKDVLFSGISGTQHDHGIHAFVFGPDGKLYFNFGNAGRQLKDKDGKLIIDKSGHGVTDQRKPYQQGMVFRCNLDGSEVETLGWNFRNNWEVCIDSFGTLWQSDNDDDGNKGVRINYVMEFGNYGYRSEVTGAGWKAKRTGMGTTNAERHWHQRDPGVVPNLLATGAGSPCGITVYEGTLLPPVFRNQMIHCDAGPSITRAYPVKKAGAGYTATIVNMLDGTKKNKWFRPCDVTAMPDGSLMVADWYDPGVGGHNMRDPDRGRLFLVGPKGHKWSVPKVDTTTPEGAVAALKSPNQATRYLGWTALVEGGKRSVPALEAMVKDENPRFRARAYWVLGAITGKMAIADALKDPNPDIRIVGIRMARQKGSAVFRVAGMVDDPDPQVRRECAIALHGSMAPEAPGLWAKLAMQHDGEDRWYLEALGIGAAGNEDGCFEAWLKAVGDGWNSPAGRDIIWRSRSKHAPEYLAKVVKSLPSEDHPRYMRAFDFHQGPEKDKALLTILGL